MSDDTRPFSPYESGLSDAPTGQLRPPATLTVEVGGRTDKGRVRPGNEDAFGLEPPTSAQARAHGTLLVVSDGMGGHAAGEVASNLAVDTIKTTFYRDRGASPAESIENAISAANGVIFEDSEQNPARAGMGCTVVVMLVQGSSLTVGHVGDSRGYLIRGGRARQITRDHSWVAMQVEEGVLTPEQAEHHPNRSLLMRALGRQPSVEVEIGHHQLQAGDVLILCSDGLTNVVNDAEIGEYASRYAPATAADQLVNLANQRGAPDNVTVVAASITSPAGAAAATGASTTVTMSAPPADALTSRLVQPPAATGTGTTQPMRAPAAPTSPHLGTPVVLSRESAPPRAAAPVRGRRGRGRWLAGSLAAFGLATGLVLLTMLGPRTVGDVDAPRATDPAVASKPAATQPSSGQAAPVATVPPPVATGIPGLTPPGAAVAAASPAPPAPTSPPAPTPAPTQPPAASPAAVDASRPIATPTPATASQPGLLPPLPGGLPGIAATVERAIASPPVLTLPTATPTPPSSGASNSPRDSAAGSSNPSNGAGASTGTDASTATAPTDPAAPADSAAPEENPDAAAPEMTEDPNAAQPAEGEPAADQPAAAQPPTSAPSLQAPRFTPGAGISLPPGISLPRRKPSDD
jgi:protein phosphatase